ncbi:suppressor of fused domain protein [Microbulbifer spongiae]|uniref:Suppressor of fused domain protein n=1 Tax=Microbulbifer spongiae TaxID=2944933 RepID=A0ABY9E9P7_9GAMM|nr:suppressor of fused domain protein [Microbulbifer sp. MI-G]WKD48224.1 suppressor of fused domain protein [Microbulbifer sp. MI-G]
MKMKLRKILSVLPFAAEETAVASSASTEVDSEEFWQKVYDERTAYYEKHIGTFPDDILKMGNMTGVWPGGGLFVMPADKLGKGLWAYTTFGMSNPDMPASTVMEDYKIEVDDQGQTSKYSGSLQNKKQAQSPDGAAGYGYEMIIIAKENAEWPLWFMQWTVNAEILNDAGILERVEEYNGLTVQDIQVGESESINVLIAKANKPLPAGLSLPNGKMDILIATVITDAEMQWSMENGRDVLLTKLSESGAGQISDRNRKSVVK